MADTVYREACTVGVARWFGLAIGFLALPGLTLAAQPAAQTDFVALVRQIERMVVVGDAEKLAHYRQELEGVAERPGVDEGLRRYALAYAGWRLSNLISGKERKRVLKQTEEVLKDLLKNEPDNAEALALLGAVYGTQITSAWKAMRIGPKAGKALDRAEELAPDSPRVVLQQAIRAFFAPKMFGGGLEKAEQKIRRAAELFDQEPVEKPWPNWGRVDVYAWLGQVLAKKGDLEGARTAYEKGLSIEPGHAWIRNELLPSLQGPKE